MFYRSKFIRSPVETISYILYLLISLKVQSGPIPTPAYCPWMGYVCFIYVTTQKRQFHKILICQTPLINASVKHRKKNVCKWFASLFVIVYEYMYIQYKSTPRSFKFDRWVIQVITLADQSEIRSLLYCIFCHTTGAVFGDPILKRQCHENFDPPP